MNLRIRDLVDVPPVQTVVRLDEGETNPAIITSTFVCTAEVTDHLTVFASILRRDAGCGFFLEGDFGSGKSHFLAALSAWLGDRAGAALLDTSVPALAGAKTAQHRRFLPVDISLVKYRAATPLERICTAAIEGALTRRGVAASLSPLGRFQARFRDLLAAPAIASAFRGATGIAPEEFESWFLRQPGEAYAQSVAFLKGQGIDIPETFIEERHEVFGRALDAVHGAGFDGLVLLIDELSEFFRSKPDQAALNEDARTLQLLGEIAAHRKLWIIAAVQESIERTGDIASVTFRKIKDRFPVRFHLSTLHIRDLIGKRLVRHREGADAAIAAIHEDFRRHFPRFTCTLDQFLKIYPIHPETLRLLEGLGDLFSQHRGIVDFVHTRIAGDAARGIAGILDRPSSELLAPDAIFDHFGPRLAEISAFQAFPRQVIPHLDEVIGRVIDGEDDRRLARRLVRILVLYAIHPTAPGPTARSLAELCACMLAAHDPDVNVEFIIGAILDPLVAGSRFLAKRPAASGDPLDAIYAVGKQEDHAGNLRKRIEKAMEEAGANDARIIATPLAQLPAGMSWPGPEVMRDVIERTVTWRQSVRRVLITFLQLGAEEQLAARLSASFDAGRADFAFVIAAGPTPFTLRHTAVWRFGNADAAAAGLRTLAEYFACRNVAGELHASNPSHAPLIPLAQEEVRRLEPAARCALLDLFYAGRFDNRVIVVDPSALQVQRFDRLLESAATLVLEERYPRFKEIASRLLMPSSRLYQRIIDEFICLGAISMGEARAKMLTEAIETLVAPLGLLEVKAGSYRLAPAIGEHPFLTYVFSLLRPAGPTPLDEVRRRLLTGPWGVPAESVEFLLVALAQCGVVTLQRHGRTVPLDLMPLTSIAEMDGVAPGELVSQADRETIITECQFLAPQGGFPSFGLRQQREAWQALVKMKRGFEPILADIAKYLGAMAGFAAFAAFDFDSLRRKAAAVEEVLAEVKASYPAREGIERFCVAWRESRLAAADVEYVKSAHRFFARFSEKFIYIAHYLRHPSVEQACRMDAGIAERCEAVRFILKDPMNLVVPDEGVQLGATFDLFRERYAQRYSEKHRAFYEEPQPLRLSRSEQRMVALFASLSRIEQLDRPSGLAALVTGPADAARPSCSRPLAEDLLRSPACGCGFTFGDERPVSALRDPSQEIERCFFDYCRILASNTVLEALSAHAYALRDMDAAAAGRLDSLCAMVRAGDHASAQALLDLLDERTIAEIRSALSGSMTVQNRSLSPLLAGLAGRRLTPAKAHAIFDEWAGNADEKTLFSMDSPALNAPGESAGTPGQRSFWWPLLHPELTMEAAKPLTPDEVRTMERLLEERFPAASLAAQLGRLDDAALVRFLVTEPMHGSAIQAAWRLYVNRRLSRPWEEADSGNQPVFPPSRHCIPEEAAAIDGRLKALQQFVTCRSRLMPERLRARPPATALWADAWSTRDMRKNIESAVAALAEQSADWLATLLPVEVIDLQAAPVIIIIDALPPDVWLEAAEQLAPLLHGADAGFRRLASAPQTIPSLNALFGFAPSDDPLDAFAAAGAIYHTVKGDEAHPLIDLVPPVSETRPLIVRVNLLDSAAHQASMTLATFPQIIATALSRHLPGMRALCRSQKRKSFILTADHGLSWSNGMLSHGKGGAFEEAVVRVEFKCN